MTSLRKYLVIIILMIVKNNEDDVVVLGGGGGGLGAGEQQVFRVNQICRKVDEEGKYSCVIPNNSTERIIFTNEHHELANDFISVQISSSSIAFLDDDFFDSTKTMMLWGNVTSLILENTTIPNSIQKLSKLKSLEIVSARSTFAIVPSQLDLHSLTIQKSAANIVEAFSRSINSSGLRYLDLSQNQLSMKDSFLVSMISRMQNLSVLKLSNNRFEKIPKGFSFPSKLTMIYLGNNPWKCDCEIESMIHPVSNKIIDMALTLCADDSSYSGQVMPLLTFDPNAPCFIPSNATVRNITSDAVEFSWIYPTETEFSIDCVCVGGTCQAMARNVSMLYNSFRVLSSSHRNLQYSFQTPYRVFKPYSNYECKIYPVSYCNDVYALNLKKQGKDLDLAFSCSAMNTTTIIASNNNNNNNNNMVTITGPGTGKLAFVTKGAPPSTIMVVHLVQQSSNRLYVGWSFPQFTHSPINETKFITEVKELGQNYSSILPSVIISVGVQPSKAYQVRVVGYNQYGFGTFSKWFSLTTKPACPDNISEDSETGTCIVLKSCPGKGVDCSAARGLYLPSLPVKHGFWRSSNRSSSVLRCINEQACSPNVSRINNIQVTTDISSSDDYCTFGHTGPFCESCIPGFHRLAFSGSCGVCTSEEKSMQSLILGLTSLVLLIPVVLMLMVVYYRLNYADDTSVSKLNPSIRSSFSTMMTPKMSRFLSSLQDGLYISTFFIQLYCLIVSQYPTQYSLSLTTSTDFVQVMSGRFQAVFQFSCIFPDWSSQYQDIIIGTSALVIQMVLLHLASLLFICAFSKQSNSQTDIVKSVQQTKYQAMLLILIFCYAPLVSIYSRTFQCTNFNGALIDNQYVLFSDPSVECYTSSHIRWLVVAGVLGIFTMFFVPLLFGFLIFRANQKSTSYEELNRAIITRYKPSKEWFMVFMLFSRITLTSLLPLFMILGNLRLSRQLIVLFVYLCCIIVLIVIQSPYRSMFLTKMVAAMFFILNYVVFCGLLTFSDAVANDEELENVGKSILVLVAFGYVFTLTAPILRTNTKLSKMFKQQESFVNNERSAEICERPQDGSPNRAYSDSSREQRESVSPTPSLRIPANNASSVELMLQ